MFPYRVNGTVSCASWMFESSHLAKSVWMSMMELQSAGSDCLSGVMTIIPSVGRIKGEYVFFDGVKIPKAMSKCVCSLAHAWLAGLPSGLL